MKEYESILPGAADRIVSMAEGLAEHKRGFENIALAGSIDAYKRGQVLGAGVVLLAFVIAGVALFTGHEDFARDLVGRTLIILATIFVLGRIPDWFKAWRVPSGSESNSEKND